jgi:hypothetical protein
MSKLQIIGTAVIAVLAVAAAVYLAGSMLPAGG